MSRNSMSPMAGSLFPLEWDARTSHHGFPRTYIASTHLNTRVKRENMELSFLLVIENNMIIAETILQLSQSNH